MRTPKFGANPTTPLSPAPAGGDRADSGGTRAAFRLRWEDAQLGLKVLLREHRDSGRLLAEVTSTDPKHLNAMAVSVAVVGKDEDKMVRRTVPLDVAEEIGCSGSADFGPLAEVVAELGTELGLVVFPVA